MSHRPIDLQKTLGRRQLLKTGSMLATAGIIATRGANAASAAPDAATGTETPAAAKPTDVQRGGELIIGYYNGDPDSLDPQVSAWNATSEMGNNIFDTLLWADAQNNTYKPGLATSWEINSDATQFLFHLRTGVKFSDGTPFNAAAVKFSFDRIAEPATASKLAITLLGPYDHTEVVDDATVRVYFKQPNAAFTDGLSRSNLGIASPAAVQKYGQDFGRHPVGSSYFTFKEWVANQDIKLVQNPAYNWASPLFTHQGPAYLDQLTYRSVPELATAIAALEQKELHVLGVADYRQLATLEKSSEYTIVKYTYRGFPSSYLINTEKPPTNDIQVRKALLHAINPEAVVQISFAGVPKAAHAPLTSGSLGYDPAAAKMYTYDPAKAKQILDDAGWKPGSDGIRVKDGKKLKLLFTGSSGWEPYAVPVQPMLKEVGIEMDISILTAAARSAANTAGEENLAGLGFSSSDPSVLTEIFDSKNIASGFAWSRFRSPQLDSLLEKAQGVGDVNERVKQYAQIQEIIMENALCVPLVEGLSAYVMQKSVQGVTTDTRGFAYWYDAWIKK